MCACEIFSIITSTHELVPDVQLKITELFLIHSGLEIRLKHLQIHVAGSLF